MGWNSQPGSTSSFIPGGARISRVITQSLSTGVTTKILFDTIDYDTLGVNGSADVATNQRINITRSGKYMIIARCAIPNLDGTEQGNVYIYVDGTQIFAATVVGGSANELVYPVIVCVQHINAGQYIEMYAMHNEGASQDTFTTIGYLPRLVVNRLS